MGKPKYYDYDPSLAATAIFAGLFGLSTLCHMYQLFRSKTWYFIPFIIGGLFETAGYLLRTISVTQKPDYDKPVYITMISLILLAPALYAASIYMVLGRLIILVDGEHLSIIKRKWLTKLFVAGDIASFIVQAAGGSMQASAERPSQEKSGRYIVIAGLFIQIVVFTLFFVVVSIFHFRIVRQPTSQSRVIQVPWLQFIYVLYGVSALIMARSIFRVAEYIQGKQGELMTNEIYFYVLDTALMFIVSGIFNVFHPSRIIQGHGNDKELDSLEGLNPPNSANAAFQGRTDYGPITTTE